MNQYNVGSGTMFERAEKELFAVYQTLYSNADTELWYDWGMRLKDTQWSENGFFLMKDGQKLGGAIIDKGQFCYPFLVQPFADRGLFYRLLHAALLMSKEPERSELIAHGVLDEDVEALVMLGYTRTPRSRRVMIRPTDRFEVRLPAGFCAAVPAVEQAAEITEMLNQAYAGGINEAVFGLNTVDDVVGDIQRNLATGTNHVSTLVYEEQTGKLVGACLAGVDPNAVNGFAGIAEVAVLPDYQSQGLASYMIQTALNNAYRIAKAMKLVVTVGNPAEGLYRKLGFIPGPRFTRMRFGL